MRVTRRTFLKQATGTAVGLSLIDILGWPQVTEAVAKPKRLIQTKEVTTICPYCGVGCGMIAAVRDGEIVNIEGDPDHPINEGALCSKGSSVANLRQFTDKYRRRTLNPQRLTKVFYRAPGSDHWEEKDWAWAFEEIAKRVKKTRDSSFELTDDKGVRVNRTLQIAHIGSAAIDNEENYALVKLMRALGVVAVEHHARLCHASTVAGLAPTFGRGAMTNHWIDYRNSDVIMSIGANPAEQHPLSMKWIKRAQAQRGAKFIAVDPRFTRTAAEADLYVPIRPGTDIAFIGGLINYALQNDLIALEYVKNYTNASYLVHPDFSFNEGLFSGFIPGPDGQGTYNKDTWQFQKDAKGEIKKDPELKDPQTVYQLLKKHYSRYDPKTVSKICGVPEPTFLKAAELFCSTGRPGKAGNVVYTMGITQSTHGTQNVRALAILQLLLGNIGVAGGGVNAQRGEGNVQGSTDMGVLFASLPGYLAMPSASSHPSLAKYLEVETPKTSYWSNKPKFFISLLKAWWGKNATKENDFCYDYLPKLDGKDHSHMAVFEDIFAGKIKGLFAWGQNISVDGPNAGYERKALQKLDWLVGVDLFETETVAFWKEPGVDPKTIKTEIFLLPAAASFEKEGSITNSGRWIQWRYKAVEPPGEAKSDLWIADRLYKALRRAYQADPQAVFPNPILELNWDYGDEEPDPRKVAAEINGYNAANGGLLANFTQIKDDGSTACGCWIYSGYWSDPKKPACQARTREKEGGLGLHSGWAYAWPLNRRILYNRASADVKGQPWDPARALVAWDGSTWVNKDVPDFVWKTPDGKIVPPETSAKNPFIMMPTGQAALWVTTLKDGPIPEHYEPVESPVKNLLSNRQFNPTITIFPSMLGKLAAISDEKYPYIATTFRMTEHWQSGAMTRRSPWLVELVPEMFIEISPTLAQKLGVKSGDLVRVTSLRGAIVVKANVTPRLKPLRVHEREIELVGMPWHWGFMGLSQGESANKLTAHIGDANVSIPEYKAFLCNVTRA